MSFETWLMFALTEAVMCMIPGPAVLMVVSIGLTRSLAESIRAALGVLAANAFYFLLSATGVGALLAASHEAFMLLRWFGAAYLFWLGARMLLAGSRVCASRQGSVQGAVKQPPRPGYRTMIQGFVTQAANPKALIFFLSLLPQFVNPAAPLLPQITLLAVTSIGIEFVILSAYATLASHAVQAASQDRIGSVVERAGGTLLLGAALGLASMSNRAP